MPLFKSPSKSRDSGDNTKSGKQALPQSCTKSTMEHFKANNYKFECFDPSVHRDTCAEGRAPTTTMTSAVSRASTTTQVRPTQDTNPRIQAPIPIKATNYPFPILEVNGGNELDMSLYDGTSLSLSRTGGVRRRPQVHDMVTQPRQHADRTDKSAQVVRTLVGSSQNRHDTSAPIPAQVIPIKAGKEPSRKLPVGPREMPGAKRGTKK